MQLRPSSVRGNLAASLPNLFSSQEIILNFDPSPVAFAFPSPLSIIGIGHGLRAFSNPT
jgi:hypothetical protein